MPSTVRPWRACRRAHGGLGFRPEVAVGTQMQSDLQLLDGVLAAFFDAGIAAPPVPVFSSCELDEDVVVVCSSATPGVEYWAGLALEAGALEPAGSVLAPGTTLLTSAMKALPAVSLRRAALVCAPTTPSTLRPWLAWKLRTAASVSGPKTPSTLTPPSAC